MKIPVSTVRTVLGTLWLACQDGVLQLEEHGDLHDVVIQSDPVVEKLVPASLPELEGVGVDEEEFVLVKAEPLDQPQLEGIDENELFQEKTQPINQPELEGIDKDELVHFIPGKTEPFNQAEVEGTEEDELVPVKTEPSNQPELEGIEEDELVPVETEPSKQPLLEYVVEEKEPILEKVFFRRMDDQEGIIREEETVDFALSPNLDGSGKQQTNPAETLDASLQRLVLVEELVDVFTSHQWDPKDSEMQLARLRTNWQEKRRTMTEAEATSCVVEASMKARLGFGPAQNHPILTF